MRIALVMLLALAVLGAVPAHATVMDGATIRLTYEFPSLGAVWNVNTHDLVVGPGVEISNFPVGDPRTNVDVSDTNIFVTYNSSATWTPAAFNGFHIFDLFGSIPDFTAVSINPITNLTGFGDARITFDADNIWVDWNGLSFDSETIVSLDVEAVPEPGTLLLLGTGIAGLAARRRQRSGRTLAR
jgi:hypothetical protein